MEHYHKAAMHVFHDGALPRTTKELICASTDALQLYDPGSRIYMYNALEPLATVEETIEAPEAVNIPGIHYLCVALPAIFKEIEGHKRGAANARGEGAFSTA